jgi:hypothetical protein
MSEERRAGLTQDEFNQIAWRDFLIFAMNEGRMVDAFNRATGRHYQERGASTTDAQLASDTEAFVLWVTENHWGMDYAPLSYQKDHNVV